MPSVDSVEAHIEVHDRDLVEHDDEELDAAVDTSVPTKSTYIEVCAGQRFAARVTVHPSYRFDVGNCVVWHMFIDGTRVATKYSRQTDRRPGEPDTCWLRYHRSGHGSHQIKQNFMFGELDITQENAVGDPKMGHYTSLGTIKLEAWKYFMERHRPEERNYKEAVTFESTIPEKALKGRAVTLGARLGDAIPASRHLKSHRRSTTEKQPFARFIFHYRTRKSLQELMIIPRDNEFSGDDDIEGMTADQLRTLLLKERAERSLIEIKEEQEIDPKRDHIDIVSDDHEERTVKKAKKGNDEARVVIEIDSD